ncbi:MAG: helix-turn-helix domain-containing protein [Armatimonadota bacterium]
MTIIPLEEFALIFLLEGSAWAILDGEEYRMQSGDIHILTGGGMHVSRGALKSCTELAFLWINLQVMTRENLFLTTLFPPPKCITGTTARRMLEFGEVALKVWNERLPGYSMMTNGLALQILALAYAAPEADILQPCCRHPYNPQHARTYEQLLPIQQAICYITAHYQETLTFDQIAAQVPLHPSYFCRLFHTLVGLPPMKFLEYTRLLEADRLLLGTDKSINEIARAVGFDDPNYFGRVFRRVYRLSPTAYRRQVNSSPQIP